MLTSDLIDLVVERAFDEAAAKFKVMPTAENWNKLSGAMLVMQQWNHSRNDGSLFADLANRPVREWPEAIVHYACDDRSIADVLADKP